MHFNFCYDFIGHQNLSISVETHLDNIVTLFV